MGAAGESPPRIVVVDDDQDVLEALRALLESAGYDVTTVESAFGTKSLIEEVQPAAILLDLSLPFRFGMLLLKDLKSTPTTSAIPVVIVSGIADVLPASEQALAAAVVAKPFENQHLLDLLQRHRL
jgi:FixJ family two-component response regulator